MDRETAVRNLLEFRELAYPTLKRMTTGSDPDLAKRAAEVIRKLEAKVGADKLKVRDLDTLHAAEFTLSGRIEAPTLKGRTTYFGEVSVQVAELRTIRFLGGIGGKTPYFGEVKLQVAEVRALRSVAFGMDTTVQVDAARYLDQAKTEWLDTDFELTGDTPIEVVASGSIRLYPGNGYEATPKGHASYVTVTHPAGALLGKVGESGEVFLIGDKYNGIPKGQGKLYLRMAPSPWPNQAQGTFTVTVTPNPVR